MNIIRLMHVYAIVFTPNPTAVAEYLSFISDLYQPKHIRSEGKPNKIRLIKFLRSVTDMGLKDAKYLCDILQYERQQAIMVTYDTKDHIVFLDEFLEKEAHWAYCTMEK